MLTIECAVITYKIQKPYKQFLTIFYRSSSTIAEASRKEKSTKLIKDNFYSSK
jgi:hypothetical protein